MSDDPKFSKIKDLYPHDHEKFYAPPATTPAATPADDPDTELDSIEDLEMVEDVPQPEKTTALTNSPRDPTLVEKMNDIVKKNLLNIVILLVGFFLMSHETVVSFIHTKVSDNSLTNIAIRGLGLVAIFLGVKLIMFAKIA